MFEVEPPFDLIIRRFDCLHPVFRPVAEGLDKALTRAYQAGATKTHFKVFETLRHPLRQNELLSRGTTKAGAWESAHQYGLAADFVPYLSADEALILAAKVGERVDPGWNWHSSHDWKFLRHLADATFGTGEPISWDPGHVQSSKWPDVRRAYTTIR